MSTLHSLNASRTPMQQEIARKMQERGMSMEQMVSELADLAMFAEKESKTGEMVADNTAKMQALKFLAELGGFYQPSNAKVNINLGFADRLYNNEREANESTDEIIEVGEGS